MLWVLTPITCHNRGFILHALSGGRREGEGGKKKKGDLDPFLLGPQECVCPEII